MNTKPLILITNDDGVTAPGIRALIKAMNTLGEVWVVAPDKPQSGMGHAVTINTILCCPSIKIDNGPQREYACSGTPADCVKLAKDKILPRIPDLCVSGINHGSNASINVIYSGTMSAAIEAAVEGIPSIGFSILDHSWEADFDQAMPFVVDIARKVLENGMPKDCALNVNIPMSCDTPIKGIKVCRQAPGKWVEEYMPRTNPNGEVYYWMTGKFDSREDMDDTDQWALKNGYISVVPCMFDLTSHRDIDAINHTLKSDR